MINWLFEQVIFPEIFKNCPVTPDHKKEDILALVYTTLYLYYQFSVKYLKNLYITEFTPFTENIE